MKARQTLLLGLTGLGFVLVLPAYATSSGGIDLRMTASAKLTVPELSTKLHVSELRDGSFMVAKRDEGDSRYESRGEQRDDPRAKGNPKHQTRDSERSLERQDYGYGYERRQQQPPRNEDDHGRH